jgi:hypothetical protein
MEKGSVTQTVNALRFVDGGEITSLTESFTKGRGAPFSIKLVPKSSTNMTDVEFVDLVFYQGDTMTPIQWPIDVLSWSAELIIEFSSTNSALLTNYRIFWASGSDIVN